MAPGSEEWRQAAVKHANERELIVTKREGEERCDESILLYTHSPAVLPSNERGDLSAAFGPLFRVLPKELLAKIVPVERTVMLCRLSEGARQSLMAVKPAAVVKAKEARGLRGLEIFWAE